MRRIALALVFVLAMFPSGVVLAHSYSCWTAGPGYTINCGPVDHWFTDPYTGDQYGYSMTTQVSQTYYGSFDWQQLRLTNGWESNEYGEMGMAYLYSMPDDTKLLSTDAFYCDRIALIYNSVVLVTVHNPTTTGYWYMYDGPGACYYSTWQDVHTQVINAY